MKNLFTSFVTIVIFWGCSSTSIQETQSDNSHYIKHYAQADIDSIIQHNNYTVIFGWTEWCKASQNQLKEYLIPFLEEKPDNIGIVSVCCASSDKLINFLEKNDYKYTVYLLSGSFGGLDKQRLKRRFQALFDNYKSVNYIPIVILCDSQKQILNWDTTSNCYHGIGTTILQIKNNQY